METRRSMRLAGICPSSTAGRDIQQSFLIRTVRLAPTIIIAWLESSFAYLHTSIIEYMKDAKSTSAPQKCGDPDGVPDGVFEPVMTIRERNGRIDARLRTETGRSASCLRKVCGTLPC